MNYNDFRKYSYHSSITNRQTNVNVLLPDGYNETTKYPVLYILHGFFCDETWMAQESVGIREMAEKLYTDGEAEKMIIVLPYMFTSKKYERCTVMDLESCEAYDNFIYELTADLMPFVERTFSVRKGRENTALTGFSMGGREALFIGFSRPDLFAYIGAVCAAPRLVEIENSPLHPGQMKKSELIFDTAYPIPKILLSAAVNDPAVGTAPESYHKIMLDNNVPHIWRALHGTGHDESSVKPHLREFLKLIFKESATDDDGIHLRGFRDSDMEIFRRWLYSDHVKRWYENPSDWLSEAENRNKEYNWIHHFIAEYNGQPIGFCQYYEYIRGGETWHGDIDTDGVFSIDYLIGEHDFIGKGLGKKLIETLLAKIRKSENARLVIVQPERDNKASCGALLSCGFTFDEDDGFFSLAL